MKKFNLLFILLILLTLFLRLFFINLTILESDMFRDLDVAKDIINGNIRYTGIGVYSDDSGMQQSFGPLMHYMTAVSFLIYNNSLSPVFMVAILNGLAVLLCFLFCKKYFNEKVAFFASFLYTVNPWHIYLSHIFWNPNFLPFFSILFFYFLFGYVIDKKDYFLIISCFILSLMLHFHLTPLFFIPVIILSILFFRRDMKLKYYFYSLIAFILPFLPFIYYNLKMGYSFFGPILYGSSREASSFFTSLSEAFGVPIMLSTNYLGKYVYGNSNIFGYSILQYFYFFITILLVILFLASFIFLLFKIKTYKKFMQNKKYSLLFLIFILSCILNFFRFAGISPHYYFFLYPIQFIIIGIFLAFLYKRFVNNKLFIGIFLAFLIVLIFNSYLLFNYVNKNGATAYPGEYSIPYKIKLEVINYIFNDAKSNNIDIVFFRYGKSFKYLLDLTDKNITYYYLNDISKFKDVHGYLILDRISYHRTPELTPEENSYFDNLSNKTVIKNVEIYKF